MRRTVQPTVNQTVTQKYGNSIGQRFRPLREFTGKARQADGSYTIQSEERWVDLVNRKKYAAAANWDDAPPDLPSGDAGREPRTQPPSALFRHNYSKINWEL